MKIDPAPVIEGALIRLRPPTEADIERRAALGRHPEISRSFGGSLAEPEPVSKDDARAHLNWSPDRGVRWVIAVTDDDRFIGTTRLDRIDTANRSANFAIGIFDPDALGVGLGTEATQLVLQFGFGPLDLHRISLTVLADNARAIAAYRKCGFEIEGRLRQTLWRDGAWTDDLVMAILEPGFRDRDASEGRPR